MPPAVTYTTVSVPAPVVVVPQNDWESEVTVLLDELSNVQDELLAVLAAKRERLAVADLSGAEPLQLREQELSQRLEKCQAHRAAILQSANSQGYPTDTIEGLAGALPLGKREGLGKRVKESQAKMRLLQHQSLTNWVLAQRGLLHVSQMLEIIATGGRLQPTYGDREGVSASGSLLDHQA